MVNGKLYKYVVTIEEYKKILDIISVSFYLTKWGMVLNNCVGFKLKFSQFLVTCFFRFVLQLDSNENDTLTLKPNGSHGKDLTTKIKIVENEIAETDYVNVEQGKYE